MIAVIQRVQSANVVVDNKVIGEIGPGILTFLGVQKGDSPSDSDWLLDRILGLRLFADENGKMNLSLKDLNRSHLIVSQFTLAGNCSKGRRPSFDSAENPQSAESLYNYFCKASRDAGVQTSTGRFGADMQVNIVNDGPVTFILDTRNS